MEIWKLPEHPRKLRSRNPRARPSVRERMKTKLPAVLVALALSSVPASACTTFCLRDGGRIVFGKNYDWAVGDGLLVVNKRGVARKADAEGDPKPASWTSRLDRKSTRLNSSHLVSRMPSSA